VGLRRMRFIVSNVANPYAPVMRQMGCWVCSGCINSKCSAR